MSIRIAMWSGPRNISTAMMRAFENRDDTVVVDEPFYACYLHATGIRHPMNEEIIASQSTDWATVAATLSADRDDAAIIYQKQMTHHMLPGIDLEWTRSLRNCFLIRDPEYVVNSYVRKRASVTQDDIGIKRQFELFMVLSELTGQDLPVIDSKQFLLDPEAGLRRLCQHLGIPFSDKMLHWPRGRRASDGVWAAHWYQAVENSTGFQAFSAPAVDLDSEQRAVVEEANHYYEMLLARC